MVVVGEETGDVVDNDEQIMRKGERDVPRILVGQIPRSEGAKGTHHVEAT